ncbi:hypothetical protein ARMSODRAFT_211458 [Armillaria solidipes]|uniref:Peptidase C14 caspase domain-containing protein n=1 Tax=Armillaria solidipes TaxID=1076256 RepID=A0A2H3BBJ3_9AGAR|nr:hypothetical protein ARMSODRAFT_211458 [Armillaria solidipes]
MTEVRFQKTEKTRAKTSPKRKALIVAVQNTAGGPALCYPHRDARNVERLLTDVYHYTEVTVLLDDSNPATQPTRTNLIKHMQELTQDVQSGDHLFFYFSGHATQRRNFSGSEEDEMDELLYTKSGGRIRDNILRKYLVDDLPEGCYLTAVLDACHSGSLLDLAHYRCNRVLGPRRSNSWGVVPTYAETRKLKRRNALNGNTLDDLDMIDPRLASAFLKAILDKFEPNLYNDFSGPGRQILDESDTTYESPISELFCTGLCKTSKKSSQGGYVICLSSCKDSQSTWETNDGWSMTSALIELCEREARPTLAELMSNIT